MGKLNLAIVTVTPFQQNCSLLFDGDTLEGVVIDPGGELDRIEKAIAETRIKPSAIVLTHGHIDHAGGAEDLKAKLGVDIIGPHRDDLSLLQGLEVQAQMFGVPPGEVRNVTPDQWLDEGETLEMAGRSFDIYHCPGHSPGSVVFVQPDERVAIVGDVLFQGSIGRTDLPGGNHADLISSIKTKLLPLGDDIQFVCGHGPGSTFGAERRTNPFLV
ncbi:MAG: MBL fold metallo-hydrolase [Pseudomonadota bacterium]